MRINTKIISLFFLGLLWACGGSETNETDAKAADTKAADTQGQGIFTIEPGQGLTVDDEVLAIGDQLSDLTQAFSSAVINDLGELGATMEVSQYGFAAYADRDGLIRWFYVGLGFPTTLDRGVGPGSTKQSIEEALGSGVLGPFGVSLSWPAQGLAAELDGDSVIGLKILGSIQ
jgi:hypothetical protein